MRIKTEELFRQTEALRRRVEELETGNNLLTKALLRSNDEIQRLANRVKYAEQRLQGLGWSEPFSPPSGGQDGND